MSGVAAAFIDLIRLRQRHTVTGIRSSSRAKRRVLTVLSVTLGLLGAAEFWLHITSDPLTDFRVYYDAAARLNSGLPLYPPGARIYPPLFEMALRPLALLPYELAAAIWVAIILGAFGLTLRRIGIRRPATWYTVGLLGVGIGWSLAIGQAEVIVTLLLALGNPMAVALAANIKLFPLLVGTYWLARQEWRKLGLLASWTAGLVLLQLVLDPANTVAFPATLGIVGSQIAESGEHVLSPYARSPILWATLLFVGLVATIRLGRTRWGWASATALAVLASPHLLAYMLMSLLACLRPPDDDMVDEHLPSAAREAAELPPGPDPNPRLGRFSKSRDGRG
jgi:hypothetical protein